MCRRQPLSQGAAVLASLWEIENRVCSAERQRARIRREAMRPVHANQHRHSGEETN